MERHSFSFLSFERSSLGFQNRPLKRLKTGERRRKKGPSMASTVSPTEGVTINKCGGTSLNGGGSPVVVVSEDP
ncbi:hypothetical protein J1N35_023677 [Gossypium stocksii]|uniref:Uncharacterized protein n=1 Tax=Gossypium stocksii TaxID=47602 RepID=A0A9D4A2B3_9ROSI|nr:hypothetical protein J1N35_023677 [Gossypium stocksii]